MAQNEYPVGFNSFQDGSQVGGTTPNLDPYDEVRTYEPLVVPVGESNKIYVDEATNSLYIYHSGAYVAMVGGSGVDAFQTYLSRANTTENVAPTVGEIAVPIENATAEINLNGEIIERWTYLSGAWSKKYSLAHVEGAITYANTSNSNAIGTAPTLIQIPTPLVNDVAIMSNQSIVEQQFIEYWKYNGALWVSTGVISLETLREFSIRTANFSIATPIPNSSNAIDSTLGAVVVNLPLVSTTREGVRMTFKWVAGANLVTLNPAGAIDGLASFSFNNLMDSVTIEASDSEWRIVGSHIEATGGLTKQGVAPAVLVDEGIYLVDGSNPILTLPISTGSQDRYIFHSESAGVNVVVGVQLGDTLSGTTDGTHTIADATEVGIAIDSSLGNWVYRKLGDGTDVSLAYTEIGVTSSTDAVIAPFDTIVFEKVSGTITTDGSTMTVNKTGFFEVKAKVGVSTTNPDAVIKVNGVVVKTVRDGSIENRLIAFAHQFTAGDTVTIEAQDGITLENWLGGASSPTTDMNYCQIIFSELPSSVSLGISPTGDGIDTVLSKGEALTTHREIEVEGFGLFIKDSGSTNYTQLSNEFVSSNAFKKGQFSISGVNAGAVGTLGRQTYRHTINTVYAGITTISFSYQSYFENQVLTLHLINNDTIEREIEFGVQFKQRLDSANPLENIFLAGGERVSIDFYVFSSSVLYPVDTLITERAEDENYTDIGAMRIAWGKRLSITDNPETVNFGVSFAVAPTVTIGVDTGSSAGAGGNWTFKDITTTSFLSDRQDTSYGNTQQAVLNWIAIGLKA